MLKHLTLYLSSSSKSNIRSILNLLNAEITLVDSVPSPWNKRSLGVGVSVAYWLCIDDQIMGELIVLISVESYEICIHILNHVLDLVCRKEMKCTLKEHYMLPNPPHQTIPCLLMLWWLNSSSMLLRAIFNSDSFYCFYEIWMCPHCTYMFNKTFRERQQPRPAEIRNANMSWVWPFHTVIRFMVNCIMPTNFRL